VNVLDDWVSLASQMHDDCLMTELKLTAAFALSQPQGSVMSLQAPLARPAAATPAFGRGSHMQGRGSGRVASRGRGGARLGVPMAAPVPTPWGMEGAKVADDDGDADANGGGASAHACHELPPGLGACRLPVVCVTTQSGDSLRSALGVSRECCPVALVPTLTQSLLESKGYPAGLITKAMQRFANSPLRAEQWLHRHHDMLLMQHELLSDLTNDVIANPGLTTEAPADAFAGAAVRGVCFACRCR
jgi:hypothetical protein